MASAAGSYKRMLQLLEKWPLDKSKAGGRDLAEYLRSHIDKAYRENHFEANHKYWDQQYLAAQKIVNNTNKHKYKRSLSSTATGLTKEQCSIALSNEFLNQVNIKEKFSIRQLFSGTSEEKN
ncbi:uncharacterized protein LOC132708346 [Cylas formicarius]|uniref:uncharacterized protein LOC132708346 n=1 Tax=Cylas formicarius TaxID=197179 RepID=UPI00295878CA|nr:uncharacterized protein LOC132708346 [Cylas formicarius]